jgi:hypothetical protein
MLHPTTTGLQVAGHDAWLAEMRKEPSPELGRAARPKAEVQRRKRLASQQVEMGKEPSAELGGLARPDAEAQREKGLLFRLADVAKRLWSRQGTAVPSAPESNVQAKGASV